jgi:hypothetical protein
MEQESGPEVMLLGAEAASVGGLFLFRRGPPSFLPLREPSTAKIFLPAAAAFRIETNLRRSRLYLKGG